MNAETFATIVMIITTICIPIWVVTIIKIIRGEKKNGYENNIDYLNALDELDELVGKRNV